MHAISSAWPSVTFNSSLHGSSWEGDRRVSGRIHGGRGGRGPWGHQRETRFSLHRPQRLVGCVRGLSPPGHRRAPRQTSLLGTADGNSRKLKVPKNESVRYVLEFPKPTVNILAQSSRSKETNAGRGLWAQVGVGMPWSTSGPLCSADRTFEVYPASLLGFRPSGIPKPALDWGSRGWDLQRGA